MTLTVTRIALSVWLIGVVVCLIWLPGWAIRRKYLFSEDQNSLIAASVLWPLGLVIFLMVSTVNLYKRRIERIRDEIAAAQMKPEGFTNGPYSTVTTEPVRVAQGTWTASSGAGTTTTVGPEFVNVTFTARPTDPYALVNQDYRGDTDNSRPRLMTPAEYGQLKAAIKTAQDKMKPEPVVHKKSRYDLVKQPNNQKERG